MVARTAGATIGAPTMGHARVCLAEEARCLRADLVAARADTSLKTAHGRALIAQMERDLADVGRALRLIDGVERRRGQETGVPSPSLGRRLAWAHGEQAVDARIAAGRREADRWNRAADDGERAA